MDPILSFIPADCPVVSIPCIFVLLFENVTFIICEISSSELNICISFWALYSVLLVFLLVNLFFLYIKAYTYDSMSDRIITYDFTVIFSVFQNIFTFLYFHMYFRISFVSSKTKQNNSNDKQTL